MTGQQLPPCPRCGGASAPRLWLYVRKDDGTYDNGAGYCVPCAAAMQGHTEEMVLEDVAASDALLEIDREWGEDR